MAPPPVFISYSHDDEAWKDRLVEHLEVLAQEGLLDVWDDRRIAAGKDWQPEIEEAMSRAQVAVLLITASYLISKFIRGNEIPRLLQRRREEGLRIIPVIVRPCAWKGVGWLAAMQCWPRDGRALSGGTEHEIDTALAALAEEINAQGSPPARVVLRKPDERAVRLPGQRRLPRLWLRIALVVLPLAALLFSRWDRSRGVEAADREFSCPPDRKQSVRNYREDLEAGRKALTELDIPNANTRFNNALCSQDLPEARIGFAKTLVELGRPKQARKVAMKALDRADELPREKRPFIEAEVFAIVGDWERAVPSYRELLRRDPGNVELAIGMASAQTDAGKPEDALDTVKAFPVLDPSLALVEAKAAEKTGDVQRELAAASRAISAGEKHPFIAAKGHLFHALALHHLHHSQEALAELEKAGILAAGNQPLVSDVLRNKGAILLSLGAVQGALSSFRQAAKETEQRSLGSSAKAALNRQNLGIVYDKLGELTNARKNFEIALVEVGVDQPRMRADIANNLGLVLEHQGDLEKAREYLQQAVDAYRQLARELDEASGLCNLAQVKRLLLNVGTPELDVSRCRKLADHSGDKSALGDALAAEGNLALWQGDLDNAMDKHQEALKLRQEVGEADMIAESRLFLAVIELEKGRPAEAKTSVQKALEYYRNQKAVNLAALARVRLAQIYLALRELPAARQESDRAEKQAGVSELLELRVHSALTAARIADAQERIRDAFEAAKRALSEAQKQGHPFFGLEAELVLGEVALKHPDPEAPSFGCETLQKVEERAHEVYGLVAQKAQTIRKNAQPPCPEAN